MGILRLFGGVCVGFPVLECYTGASFSHRLFLNCYPDDVGHLIHHLIWEGFPPPDVGIITKRLFAIWASADADGSVYRTFRQRVEARSADIPHRKSDSAVFTGRFFNSHRRNSPAVIVTTLHHGSRRKRLAIRPKSSPFRSSKGRLVVTTSGKPLNPR